MGWDHGFDDRVANHEVVIGVVGLGYVGLPTALGFYHSGFTIWGIEVSNNRLSDLLQQKNPIREKLYDNSIPPPNDERWNLTDSYSKAIPQCDVVIVTVPTPVSEEKRIDPRFVIDAGKSIFSNIKSESKTIVILESTVYPGLTRELWIPLIEDCNLSLGPDLELAYCPERYSPGDTSRGIDEISRIIGAINPAVGNSLIPLYGELTNEKVYFVGDLEVAESAKLIENVQRDINIALVNELATILPKLGVDIEEVLDAASSKWNFHRYTPGVGVGGHCIPVDPYFLINQAQLNNSPVNLISSGRKINTNMPIFVADEIHQILKGRAATDGKRKILIFGWSYKPEIGDTRGSPSKHLGEELSRLGHEIHCWDSFVDSGEYPDWVLAVERIEDIRDFDIVILATAHKEFLDLDWSRLMQIMRDPVVYDARRCLPLSDLKEMGWEVFAIGMPN